MNPSYLILRALAKVLHISLDTLINPDVSLEDEGVNQMKMLYSSCPPEMRDTLLHHTQETVKELTELSEKFETNWASEWILTILSLFFFIFGEKRQAMPVLIHTGPQRRKSLCDFPLRLLVEGSAPKPFWTQNFILWLRGLRSTPVGTKRTSPKYDIYSIRSMRWNPVIADLFHRMKYMERRGSDLRKIVSETEKLPGYTEAYKPEFSSTATDFRVILKNVNYHHGYKPS